MVLFLDGSEEVVGFVEDRFRFFVLILRWSVVLDGIVRRAFVFDCRFWSSAMEVGGRIFI